jgi:hypothetical protein
MTTSFAFPRQRFFERVVLCVGFLGERIRGFARHKLWITKWVFLRRPATAGHRPVFIRALPLLGDAFCVIYSVFSPAITAAQQVFLDSGKAGLMSVFLTRAVGRSNVEFARAPDHTIRRTGRRVCSTSITAWAFRSAAFGRARGPAVGLAAISGPAPPGRTGRMGIAYPVQSGRSRED